MDVYGKKFEAKLKSDWFKIPGAFIYRLKDIMSGYKKISNVSDFVGYMYPYMYLLEAKTVKDNTFNFSALRQYDDLKDTIGYPGLNSGVVIWFYNKQKVCYVPIEECVRIREELGKKSIHVNMIGNSDYKVYEIPSTLRRTFLDSDYTILNKIADEKYKSITV